jgi:hypothetical protein
MVAPTFTLEDESFIGMVPFGSNPSKRRGNNLQVLFWYLKITQHG